MLPRFRHLLIPLDFTNKNQAALEIGFEAAVRENASVTLLHVIETIHSSAEQPDNELIAFYNRLERQSMSELESRAQRFAEAGVSISWRVRFGARAAQIVEFAGQHQVDLIIMSSHVVDPARPAASLSTVSYQVCVMCECPIMLVKLPRAGT